MAYRRVELEGVIVAGAFLCVADDMDSSSCGLTFLQPRDQQRKKILPGSSF